MAKKIVKETMPIEKFCCLVCSSVVYISLENQFYLFEILVYSDEKSPL